MSADNPPKKNAAYTFYVGLVSQANTKVLQGSPTLAAGDVKVSIDGGALANLATLPAVTPAAGKGVKVDLSAAEMNGDDIHVVFSDAAGAEWCDLLVHLKTSVRQLNDLAFPATPGRSMVVDAAGLVDANAVKLGPTGAGTAQTARDIGASVLVGDKTGFALSAAGVQAIWDALTSALTTIGSIGKLLVDRIDAAISSRSTVAATDIVSGGAITTSGGIASSDVKKINNVTITGNGSATPFNV